MHYQQSDSLTALATNNGAVTDFLAANLSLVDPHHRLPFPVSHNEVTTIFALITQLSS